MYRGQYISNRKKRRTAMKAVTAALHNMPTHEIEGLEWVIM
jgi:hypothetical protein